MNAKAILFSQVLPQFKVASPYFTTAAIARRVQELGLEISEGTLPVYLTEATAKGLIHDAGRGWYSGLSQAVPLDAQPVAKLIRAVEKAFPLLAQPVAFLHAPIDTLESVGDTLRAKGWQVALNPAPSVGPKSVQPGEKMVVLRPTLTKQPASQGRQDAIEKVLVDLVAETQRLSLMDQTEAEGAVREILSRHLVRMAEIQSYAKFRKLKSAVFE
jgi:hypothetical protein